MCVLGHAATNSPDPRVVQVLWKSQAGRAEESLTVRGAWFTAGMTEQHVALAMRASRKRKTKPMGIGHKSLAIMKLTSD